MKKTTFSFLLFWNHQGFSHPMRSRIVLCTAILAMTFGLRGQDTLPVKKYRHEFGLDFTPFLKFYVDFSQNGYNYQPAYYLTYRYHFKKSNIRAAIGGNFSTRDISSPFSTDTHTYTDKAYSYNFRIGYEFFENLSRRWQVYYGLDFRPGYSYEKNDAPYWNGGYANGSENQSANYGIAPVLGLRFKPAKRIGIITEASFQYTISRGSSQRYYIPVNSSYPALPNDPVQKSKSAFTSFSFPLAIVVTIDF